ncbi:DNA-deoxyinosine glycosylase [Silanimonas sp.]|uniref:DNA-deoxyinosine glycosylase n=1 Tax=Silanimonas sp. TaxID=1929290 RepID=UPI0022C0AE55|nr:DNA-deoxyinosine glycosylase [Silanimonas sp.]MCZ8164420.1 DNA-deoxyinosine glycosylase [Silanimonas sp.]
MSRIASFAPAIPAVPRALVLGSMPGVASLRAGQYYAHPRNAFWPLMQALFAVPSRAPYAERLAALGEAGVALWDVLAECEREGSLDSAIAPASVAVNDITGLLASHVGLRVIALNGGTAARLFDRHVAPALAARLAAMRVLRLPSTSPAHAARSFVEKADAWAALSAALRAPESERACA